ncbi:MAG: hypothetical protein JWM14_2661, partial [Chitinophagaceae bacterium]|nr:hypothetical protein [Chitinophagaceae bacterium]
AIPKVGTTNFKGGVVLIEFNEEIEVDPNLNNIIVSPLIEGQIEIKEKKKKYLEITIPYALKENTTYSISLNNSVKDITEANILKNVTYAFSTGPLLDSLTLNGSTINIETKLPIKEALIGLYEKSDTVNIKKHKPLFLTYSDAQGIFQFNYLKKGEYSLIALEDKNKNLLFDNQEKTDFIPSISLTSEFKKPLTLELSVSDTSGNKLLSKKPSPLKQELTFRNGIKKYNYKTFNTTNKLYIFQDKKKAKNITIYTRSFEQDTLAFILYTTDSLGNNSIDTLKIDRQKKGVYKEAISFSSTSKDILSGSNILAFVSSKPITQFIPDSIFINGITITNKPFFSQNNDSLFLSLTPAELKHDTTKVDFRKGSLIFYDQDSLRQNSFLFTKADPANYSSLEMKIQTKEPNYIIQLLTEDYTILSEYKNITILNYNYINPGVYRIRVIVDKNGNGYWDRSNPLINRKAEPIYYYNNDKINLKPNWELKDLMFIF